MQSVVYRIMTMGGQVVFKIGFFSKKIDLGKQVMENKFLLTSDRRCY
jgi:hypothetical protein